MGSWKVVDANSLRKPALESFLTADSGNRVVFTEYACIEAYKGDALENISRSIEIVSGHPEQVVILKGAQEIISLQSSRSTNPSDFIDENQTHGFIQFCRDVRLALSGNDRLKETVLQHGQASAVQLGRVRTDSAKYADGVKLIEKSHDPVLCKRLRKKEALSATDITAIVKGILNMTAHFYEDLPEVNRIPDFNDLLQSFIFRYALAEYLLALRWISDGGINTAKPEKLANDHVDITHATYATYFDGLITEDRKLLDLHEEAEWLLDVIADSKSP